MCTTVSPHPSPLVTGSKQQGEKAVFAGYVFKSFWLITSEKPACDTFFSSSIIFDCRRWKIYIVQATIMLVKNNTFEHQVPEISEKNCEFLMRFKLMILLRLDALSLSSWRLYGEQGQNLINYTQGREDCIRVLLKISCRPMHKTKAVQYFFLRGGNQASWLKFRKKLWAPDEIQGKSSFNVRCLPGIF